MGRMKTAFLNLTAWKVRSAFVKCPPVNENDCEGEGDGEPHHSTRWLHQRGLGQRPRGVMTGISLSGEGRIFQAAVPVMGGAVGQTVGLEQKGRGERGTISGWVRRCRTSQGL